MSEDRQLRGIRIRGPSQNQPLTADEYRELAASLDEQQSQLDAQRTVLLARMQLGRYAPVGNDPLATLMARVDELKPHEGLLVACNGSAELPSIIAHRDTGAADITITQIHKYPRRVHSRAHPGITPSMSQVWANCQDSGEYPTLEDHKTNRSPRYRRSDDIIPAYEVLPPIAPEGTWPLS